MEVFDIIVMLVGGLLIICGLVLFVSGKRERGKNNVEAFGIKIDVSNPSILLIALGVILLLVPRLLPERKNIIAQDSKKNVIETGTGEHEKMASDDPSNIPQLINEFLPEPEVRVESQPSFDSEEIAAPNVVTLPTGAFELTAYQANGVYAPDIEGVMEMQAMDSSSVGWQSQLGGIDDFGQLVIYQYMGYIQNNGAGWVMGITNSSDPTYINQGEFPVQLNYSEEELTMRYLYLGTPIALVWEKTN